MELQWPLMLFTLFVAGGAGTLGAVSLGALLGRSKKVYLAGLAVSFGSFVFGGLCSVAHLQTPANYFKQLGNVTSGINQEIAMLGVCMVLIALSFILIRRGGEEASPNKALAAISIVASLCLVIVMSHSYMMPSIPSWNTVLLPLYYLLNSAVLGGFSFALLLALFDKENQNGKIALIILGSLVALAIIIFAYVAFFGSVSYESRLWWDAAAGPVDSAGNATAIADPDPSAIAVRILVGDLAGLFWGAVVVIGLALPLFASVLMWVKRSDPKVVIGVVIAALVCLVIGGLAFRALIYLSGASYFAY